MDIGLVSRIGILVLPERVPIPPVPFVSGGLLFFNCLFGRNTVIFVNYCLLVVL